MSQDASASRQGARSPPHAGIGRRRGDPVGGESDDSDDGGGAAPISGAVAPGGRVAAAALLAVLAVAIAALGGGDSDGHGGHGGRHGRMHGHGATGSGSGSASNGAGVGHGHGGASGVLSCAGEWRRLARSGSPWVWGHLAGAGAAAAGAAEPPADARALDFRAMVTMPEAAPRALACVREAVAGGMQGEAGGALTWSGLVQRCGRGFGGAAAAAANSAVSRCWSEWEYGGATLSTLERRVQRILAVVESLRGVVATRSSNVNSRDGYVPQAVVVGAGPVGLANALAAFEAGASVSVVEKRNSYDRDIWFDLTDRDYEDSVTVDTLRRWGVVALDPPRDDHDGENVGGVISMRCQTLEFGLSLIAEFLGVTVMRGTRFERLSSDAESATSDDSIPHLAIVYNDRGSLIALPFDLLIACDGTRSTVRGLIDASFEPVEMFAVDNRRKDLRVPGLHQTTLIARLKPNATGQCPELKTNPDGSPLSPFAPLGDPDGVTLAGVTSLWKRWFDPYCEVQILFTEEVSRELWEDDSVALAGSSTAHVQDFADLRLSASDAAFPWSWLRRALAFILANPPRDTKAVQDLLLREDDSQQYHASLFDIRIRRARPNGRVHASESRPPTVILLRGDASVSAHYRLGVGVNNAFGGLEEVTSAVEALAAPIAYDQVAERLDDSFRQAERRLERLVQMELHAMAHEAYCHNVVYLGDVLRWNKNTLRFDDVPAQQLAQPDYCNFALHHNHRVRVTASLA